MMHERAPLDLTGLTSRVCKGSIPAEHLVTHQELELEAMFAAPDFYAKPRSEIFELQTRLKTARDQVAHLYARWQELELLQSVPSP